MRRTVPLASRAGIVGAVISALILAAAPAGVLATGTPLFQPYQAIPVGSWAEAVAIGDVTGDGRKDVVMTTSDYFETVNDFRLWVFEQAPDGTLLAPVTYATAAVDAHLPESVAVGDITGDGKADVVLGLSSLGIQVFPQLANGTLGTPTLYPTTDSFKLRLGRLNNDASLDVATLGWGTNTVSVLLNNGHGGLGTPISYPARHDGYDDLEVADVSGDGHDDLVVLSGQGPSSNVISVLAQKAGGGFGPAAEYRVETIWGTRGIGVGDVTGDGRKDVVASYGGNQPTTYIAVFAQTSTGTLAAPVSYPSYDVPDPVDVADLDLDGRADVVTLHGGWEKAGVYRQQADGTLATEELYPIPYASQYNPHGLAVGDINGDGAPDVVAADYNNGLVVLLNTTTPPPGSLTALTAPRVWVGLKNSDDVGTRFDLRAEVYLGDTLVTSGEVDSVAGGSSGFNNAVLDTISLNPFAPVVAPHGSRLSLMLFVRNTCTGPTHNSGVARLWYNDAKANSAFGATIAGSDNPYYIVAGGNLSTSPGAGPQASIDAVVGAPCSAFKSFGTWSLLIP
jgi:hypothetical protein